MRRAPVALDLGPVAARNLLRTVARVARPAVLVSGATETAQGGSLPANRTPRANGGSAADPPVEGRSPADEDGSPAFGTLSPRF